MIFVYGNILNFLLFVLICLNLSDILYIRLRLNNLMLKLHDILKSILEEYLLFYSTMMVYLFGKKLNAL